MHKLTVGEYDDDTEKKLRGELTDTSVTIPDIPYGHDHFSRISFFDLNEKKLEYEFNPEGRSLKIHKNYYDIFCKYIKILCNIEDTYMDGIRTILNEYMENPENNNINLDEIDKFRCSLTAEMKYVNDYIITTTMIYMCFKKYNKNEVFSLPLDDDEINNLFVETNEDYDSFLKEIFKMSLASLQKIRSDLFDKLKTLV